MKRIAILTSGGDASGMNAAIRAAARRGIAAGFEMIGVRGGFDGLIEGEFRTLGSRDVSNVIQRGGSMLGTSRSATFYEAEGRTKALANLERSKIDALVVIGGNGSQKGAHAVSQTGFPVAGVASTIDNDLTGSDVTIGVDTALNIALEAIDRLKVTAASHRRAFLVEVMGRHCGYLAMMAAIAGGAEVAILPETPMEPETVASELRRAYQRGKSHAIAVVAEGAELNARGLATYFRENSERLGFELRVTVLGHVQRGGVPSAFDRLLGTRLGAAAVESLASGEHGQLAGYVDGDVKLSPLLHAATKAKPLDLSQLPLARVLAE